MCNTYCMPRPALPARERRSAIVQLRVRPVLRKSLERLARNQRCTLSALAEELLEAGVRRIQKSKGGTA